MEETKDVIDFYQNYDEDNRMNANPLEFIRCKEIISRYLLRNSMSILDCGGATGVFSFWLANQGHKVSLIDFVEKHIQIAKKHEIDNGISLSSIIMGDARNLPYEDESFDLVLLMGPLYHLLEKQDRLKALNEAYRVLKPNGKIICEVISRFASVIDGFQFSLVNDTDFVKIMKKDIKTGLHIDTSKSKKYFTDAYFHQPNEVSQELIEVGFNFDDLIAVTSFACTIADIENKIKDESYLKLLMDTIKSVEKEPSLMGVSSHYIGVGTK